MSDLLNAPWGFDEDGIIIDTTGNPIMRGDMTEEEFAAKGNLIAAAPELLAACEAMMAWARTPTIHTVEGVKIALQELAEIGRLTRIAITKAKGLANDG